MDSSYYPGRARNSSASGSSNSMLLLGILGVIFAFIAIIFFYDVSVKTKEVHLRNLITAKQRDNENELSNLTAKVRQSASVTEAQMASLKDIIVGYATARNNTSPGQVVTAVHDSIPNIDTSTFNHLMNIITGSSDAFAQRQTEILDLKREHDDLRTSPISGMFVGNVPEIQVVVVTSTSAKDAFATGVDNRPDNVFGK